MRNQKGPSGEDASMKQNQCPDPTCFLQHMHVVVSIYYTKSCISVYIGTNIKRTTLQYITPYIQQASYILQTKKWSLSHNMQLVAYFSFISLHAPLYIPNNNLITSPLPMQGGWWKLGGDAYSQGARLGGGGGGDQGTNKLTYPWC